MIKKIGAIADGSITNIKIADATIQGSKIAVETITSSNIANGTIVRSKLSELTTNLIIHNSDTSTAVLHYFIRLNNAGSITTYFDYPMGGVGIGMTHSIRVCIPNITTIIEVEIDTDNINVNASVVGAGAIQVGTFMDNTLSFTLDPATYDNAQIGFSVEPDA